MLKFSKLHTLYECDLRGKFRAGKLTNLANLLAKLFTASSNFKPKHQLSSTKFKNRLQFQKSTFPSQNFSFTFSGDHENSCRISYLSSPSNRFMSHELLKISRKVDFFHSFWIFKPKVRKLISINSFSFPGFHSRIEHARVHQHRWRRNSNVLCCSNCDERWAGTEKLVLDFCNHADLL
jgi:hypothetical protein